MDLKFISFVSKFQKKEDIVGGDLIRPYELFTNLGRMGYQCQIHTTYASNHDQSNNLTIISNKRDNKYLKHLMLPIDIANILYKFKKINKKSCLYVQVPLMFTLPVWSTIVSIFLVIATKVFNIKMWASMHDLSPDQEKYILRMNKKLNKFDRVKLFLRAHIKIFEQFILLRSASFITVPSYGVKKLICCRYYLNCEKVNIFRASINPDFVKYSKNQQRKLNRVGLISSVGDVDVNLLIKAMEIVRRKYPEIRLILGSNEVFPNLEKYSEFIDYFSNSKYNNFSDFLENVDILVIPYSKDPYIDIAWSLKIPMYLGSGKPLIIAETVEIRSFISDKTICTICHPNEKEIANYIIQIYENPTKFINIGIKARDFVTQELTWAITIEKIVEKLERELMD